MAKKLQLRRGTTSQHSSFTGAVGEVTVDTDKDVVVVHDGSTAGGHPLIKAADAAPTNNTTLTGTTNFATLKGLDGAHLKLGASEDFQLFFDDTNKAVIKDHGTTGLAIWTDALSVKSSDNAETQLTTADDGAVTLYYDNTARLYTNNGGAGVTGNFNLTGGGMTVQDSHGYYAGTGNDFSIIHDGTNTEIENDTGKLILDSPGGISIKGASRSDSVTTATHSSGATYDFDLSSNNSFKLTVSAAVELGFSNTATSIGQSGTIEIVNGAITPTWATEVYWAGGTSKAASLTQSATSVLAYYCFAQDKVLVEAMLDVKNTA